MRSAIERFEDWGIDHTGALFVTAVTISLLAVVLNVCTIVFGKGWLS